MSKDYADLEKRLRAEVSWLREYVEGGDDARILAELSEAAEAIASLTGQLEEAQEGAEAAWNAVREWQASARDSHNTLAELVRIKDRKDAEGPYTGYDREKNAAWAAARKVLSSDAAPEEKR
jgi:hypothetical protein